MRTTPPEMAPANGSGPAAAGSAVLACTGITKIYGGLKAVDTVSLEVPGNGLFGLCGFNGAGKSTLFSLLAGSVRADSGTVRIDGRDVTGWPATRRARSGLARTWQTVRLAHGRTAVDNVAAACLRNPGQQVLGSLWNAQVAPARERARAALERLGIGHLAGTLIDGMTLEAQRLTELARALVGEPRVLLADEPASGLSATQRTVLAEVLTTISQECAVVVVEHDLDMLTSISDHIWAMVEGRVAYSGDVETFRESQVFAGLKGIEHG